MKKSKIPKQGPIRIRVDAETFKEIARGSRRVVEIEIGKLLLESPRGARMEVSVQAASVAHSGALFLVNLDKVKK